MRLVFGLYLIYQGKSSLNVLEKSSTGDPIALLFAAYQIPILIMKKQHYTQECKITCCYWPKIGLINIHTYDAYKNSTCLYVTSMYSVQLKTLLVVVM